MIQVGCLGVFEGQCQDHPRLVLVTRTGLNPMRQGSIGSWELHLTDFGQLWVRGIQEVLMFMQLRRYATRHDDPKRKDAQGRDGRISPTKSTASLFDSTSLHRLSGSCRLPSDKHLQICAGSVCAFGRYRNKVPSAACRTKRELLVPSFRT